MSNKDRTDKESNDRVEKRLSDCDRTRGYRFEHYSREDVAAALHATEGSDHE